MLKPDNVVLAVKPVDMRRGINTLTQYMQDMLKSSWHESTAFVFANKARTGIKVLRRDKHGVWLCTRRLHQGHFHWPRANDATWSLTPEQFEWLVSGVGWQQVKGPPPHTHKMGLPGRNRSRTKNQHNLMSNNDYPCRVRYNYPHGYLCSLQQRILLLKESLRLARQQPFGEKG